MTSCLYVSVCVGSFLCVCVCIHMYFARGFNPLAIKYSFLLQYLSLSIGFCWRCEPLVNTLN